MPIPTDKKEQAIYHMILADLHRVQGLMLNLQTIDVPGGEEGIREHFTREQRLALGRLAEWRQRRPATYREAESDFQSQVFVPPSKDA